MSDKIKIIINGAGGKMGRQIVQCALQDGGFQIIGAVEGEGSPALGKDIGDITGQGTLGVKVISDLEKVISGAQVIIDFTSPESSLAIFKTALCHKIALVVGSTGFSAAQDQEFKRDTGRIPCVKAPNMSVGVNLLFKLVQEAAQVLGSNYDIEIVEAHHRLKKDAPSGTAKGILEALTKVIGRDAEKDMIAGRSGIVGERKPNEIGVHAVRAGDIVGDHTVMFAGSGERLELIHRAHSRETFARGALRAARFVVQAKPGLYDMQDVLNLKGSKV